MCEILSLDEVRVRRALAETEQYIRIAGPPEPELYAAAIRVRPELLRLLLKVQRREKWRRARPTEAA